MTIYFQIAITIMAIISIISIAQWFVEIRFYFRKKVKSFEDYGRKRNLLKLRSNGLFQISILSALLLLFVALVALLFNDYYYFSILLVPGFVLILGLISNLIHNYSYSALSLDVQFLEEEYFKIRDIEENVTQYKEQLISLESSLNQSLSKVTLFLSDVSQYLINHKPRPELKNTYDDIKKRINNQFQSIDGSIVKFKDNFTLIAQEFIQNQNRFINSESNTIHFEEISTFKENLSQIEDKNIASIVEFVNKSIKNKELNDFGNYPKIITILNEMDYQPTIQDMTDILETYPMDTAIQKEAFLNTIYQLNYINISFFESLIIPKDIDWFFNPSFYETFSEADIKKIFYKAIELESINIIKNVLSTFNPKYISYLSDLTRLHEMNQTLKELIQTYDSFLSRLNQFMNPYTYNENYLIALLNAPLDTDTFDQLTKFKNRDLSTPQISKTISDLYLEEFKNHHYLLVLTIDMYINYKKMIKKPPKPAMFDIEVLIQFILERISLLEIDSAKIGILFIIFDLLNCQIPWFNETQYTDLFDDLVHYINLNDDKRQYDRWMLEDPKVVFNEFIKKNPLGQKMGEVQLHSLLMRIEIDRLLIRQFI